MQHGNKHSVAVLGLTFVVTLVGCGDTSSNRTGAQVPQWRLEETLRIGSVDDLQQALTRVVGPVIGPDDQVYVGQPMQSEVRVFDSAGELMEVIGRQGSGPGEFDSPIMVMRLKGDSLVVVEFTGEMGFFSLDGTFLRTEMFQPILNDGRPLPTVVTDFLPDGSVLATRAMSFGDPLVILHLERSGTLIDTLFVGRSPSVAREIGTAVVWIQNPFPSSPILEVDANRRNVVEVERSPASGSGEAEFRVTSRNLTGDTTYSRAYTYGPIEISEDVVERLIAQEAHRLRQVEQNDARAAALVRQAIQVPGYYIPVTKALISEGGDLWLEMGGPDWGTRRWRVHDESGEWVAQVDVPASADLRYVRGKEAWSVVTDELDVPYVVRHRIVGR